MDDARARFGRGEQGASPFDVHRTHPREVALVVRDDAGEVEDSLAPVRGAANRLGVEDVARDDLHAELAQWRRGLGRAHKLRGWRHLAPQAPARGAVRGSLSPR